MNVVVLIILSLFVILATFKYKKMKVNTSDYKQPDQLSDYIDCVNVDEMRYQYRKK
jgi:hypothetical protein